MFILCAPVFYISRAHRILYHDRLRHVRWELGRVTQGNWPWHCYKRQLTVNGLEGEYSYGPKTTLSTGSDHNVKSNNNEVQFHVYWCLEYKTTDGKRSQLTTTKTARFQILERIGSLELMRTETVAGKLLLLRQNCKFSGKSGALRANLLVFRQNWVFLIPFDLLLMRLPSLLSPSTHCQSWFGFCVIWSYGGHMKQVAQLVPI